MTKKKDTLDKWLKDHVHYETFSFNKKTKKQSKKKSKRPINAFMVAKNKATKTDEKSFTYNGKKYVTVNGDEPVIAG